MLKLSIWLWFYCFCKFLFINLVIERLFMNEFCMSVGLKVHCSGLDSKCFKWMTFDFDGWKIPWRALCCRVKFFVNLFSFIPEIINCSHLNNLFWLFCLKPSYLLICSQEIKSCSHLKTSIPILLKTLPWSITILFRTANKKKLFS